MKTRLAVRVLIFFIGIQVYSQAEEKKYILLAWDTSFSMQNRVPEHDFKFLDNYFERNPNIRVNLVMFSNTVYENFDFQIANGDWKPIKTILENTAYDGATNLHAVESIISLHHSELLLFTDGAQSFGVGVPVFGVKTFVINSNPYKEQNDLNAILVINKGRLFDYGRPIFSQPETKNTNVLKNAEGQVQGVNDTLSPGPGISLKEVVVSENRREENPVETVNIGNGKVDKNRVGVAVQSIGDEQITPIQTDVAQSVQGRFSGVDVKRNNDLSQVKMRTDNSMILNNYGLVVIDGVPQKQSNSIPDFTEGRYTPGASPQSNSATDPKALFSHLDPENIADITVLKGLAATTRFGTLGANGVILITTKSSKSGNASGAPVDRARLKNNIYEGEISKTKEEVPDYLRELRSIPDVKLAYDRYLQQRTDHLISPKYFMDVYDFFKPKDQDIADRVLSNIAELNAKNIPTLRILAYKYELEEAYSKVLLINEQILELDENSAQAKFDFALSAEDNKEFGKAYGHLSVLVRNTTQGVNFSGLKKPAENALRNVLNTPNANITVSEPDKKYANNVRYDARVLVMWSKSNAQFELQIINPDKRFFTWEHSEISDSKRYFNDIKNDTNTEEFQLIDAQKGDWFIKVNNLNEYATVEPVYLKCIIYYNFGKPEQRKEMQLLELKNKQKDNLFFKIGL